MASSRMPAGGEAEGWCGARMAAAAEAGAPPAAGSCGAGLDLPHDVLVAILARLETREQLLSAAAVSVAWHAAAQDAEVMRRVVAAELGVIDVIVDAAADPSAFGPIAGELATVGAARAPPPRVPPLPVARRVSVDGRGINLANLAVRFGTSVGEIKRINNFASEMAFRCRRTLLVPVHTAPRGPYLARYEHDEDCKRSLFVLYTLSEYYAMLAGREEEAGKARSLAIELDGCNAKFAKQLAVSSLKRSMAACGQAGSFDDAAAAYYLEAASGDIKEALRLAREDESWELESRRR